MATRVPETTEEGVTSIGELRAVTETLKRQFGDDAQRVNRIDEKLAKREANQATYNAFQQRENTAESLLDHLHLAEAVMQQLDDKFYAHKSLASAEQAYQFRFCSDGAHRQHIRKRRKSARIVSKSLTNLREAQPGAAVGTTT